MNDKSVESCFDLDGLNELVNIMEDDFPNLVKIYIDDTQQNIVKLAQYHKNNQAGDFAEVAHSMKGASSNFYANELAGYCRDAENMGNSGDLSNAESVLDAIQQAYIIVRNELEKYLAK